MKEKNGSGSSEDLNSEFDVTNSIKNEDLNSEFDVTSSIKNDDPLDHDKMVGRASSSSFSSSSSNRLEANGGENDVRFPESEETASISLRSNPESPSTTPKTSTSQDSGRRELSLSQTVSPRFSDLDTLNLSPKQSPPIQVMDDYDPKQSIDSECSIASDESLFSIQMGNSSFSMDMDFFISQSGKIHWLHDGFEYSCVTPDAYDSSNLATPSPRFSIVKKTEEKEELLETLNASQIDTRREKEEKSPNSRVPNRIVASPTRNSDSNSSSQSTGSFAFPLLEGGSPVKEDAEKAQSPPLTPATPKRAAAAENTTEAPSTTPKAGGSQWFNCFSCFPICC